jgi:hypothetical protein
MRAAQYKAIKRILKREKRDADDLEALAKLADDPTAQLSNWQSDRIYDSGWAYWDKEKGNRAVLTAKGCSVLERYIAAGGPNFE